MLSIYNKYIFRTIIPTFLTLSLVLTSLVWITQTLRMVHLIDKGIQLSTFLYIIFLLIPSLLFMILPIVTVISIITVYNRLQDERQIIILQGAGLSNFNIAKPALLTSFFITVFACYVSAYLMPYSYGKLKEQTNSFQKKYVASLIEDRTFNQISKTATIYIDSKNNNGQMDGVIFFDNRTPENRTIFFAKQGVINISDTGDTQFQLIDGLRHSYDNNGQLTKLYFDSLHVNIENESAKSTRERTHLELYINELLSPDTDDPAKKKKMLTDGHLRIIWPLFNFGFIFLALSIFLTQSYSRKLNIKKYILTFLPILVLSYFHFSLQKMAYKDINYIFLCYLNLFLSIILAMWINMKKTI